MRFGHGQRGGQVAIGVVKLGLLQFGRLGFFFITLETVNRLAQRQRQRFGHTRRFHPVKRAHIDFYIFLLLRPGGGFFGGFFQRGAFFVFHAQHRHRLQAALVHDLGAGKALPLFQRCAQ